MAASIISFFQSSKKEASDWSAQEIAEFYRVEASLIQAGVSVSTERGLTDEGDPWFVFCRSTDGDVILHFARIDGSYLIVSEVAGQCFSGRDFRQLLKRFIDENPRLVPLRLSGNPKLALHPAALLAAAVAAALFQMPGSEAIASEINHNAIDKTHSNPGQPKAIGLRDAANRMEHSTDLQHIAAAIAVIIGLSAFEEQRPEAGAVLDFSRPLLDTSEDVFGRSTLAAIDAIPPVIDLEKHVTASSVLADSGISVTLAPLVSNTDSIHDQSVSASMVRPSEYPGLDKFFADTSGPALPPPLHSRTFQPFDVTDILETTETFDKIHVDRAGQTFSSTTASSTTKVSTARDSAHQPTFITADAPGSDVSALSASLLAFSTITNDLAVANRTAPLTTLRSDVSIHDIISFAAAKAFGPDDLHGVLDAADHAAIVTTFSFAKDISTSSAESPLLHSLVENPINWIDAALARSQSVQVHVFDAAADAIVSAFVRENKFEILNSDRNVVLFDLDSSHYTDSNFVVQTWAMNDGSTISIVGHLTQQNLLHV